MIFDFIKENRLISLIISIILNIILIFLSIFFIYRYYNYECNNNIEINELSYNDTKGESKEEFYVEVKGAVKKPSIYKVTKDNIINDVITMAGGFTKSAYTKNINLSKHVSNELVIYVYTEKEYKSLKKVKTIEKTNYVYLDTPCECSTYEITNCVENSQSEIIASDKDTVFIDEEKEEESNNGLVNINTASKDILVTLTGIGESKANDIIKYREENGLFKSIEEIKNVSGIGNALFEKIKDYITV